MRTDVPEQRFVAGAAFTTDPAERGPLTLRSAREHSGVLLLAFEGVDDREGAEALRGTVLLVDADVSDEPDAWYDHELVGLRAELADGTLLGEITGLLHRRRAGPAAGAAGRAGPTRGARAVRAGARADGRRRRAGGSCSTRRAAVRPG